MFEYCKYIVGCKICLLCCWLKFFNDKSIFKILKWIIVKEVNVKWLKMIFIVVVLGLFFLVVECCFCFLIDWCWVDRLVIWLVDIVVVRCFVSVVVRCWFRMFILSFIFIIKLLFVFLSRVGYMLELSMLNISKIVYNY